DITSPFEAEGTTRRAARSPLGQVGTEGWVLASGIRLQASGFRLQARGRGGVCEQAQRGRAGCRLGAPWGAAAAAARQHLDNCSLLCLYVCLPSASSVP